MFPTEVLYGINCDLETWKVYEIHLILNPVTNLFQVARSSPDQTLASQRFYSPTRVEKEFARTPEQAIQKWRTVQLEQAHYYMSQALESMQLAKTQIQTLEDSLKTT